MSDYDVIEQFLVSCHCEARSGDQRLEGIA